MKRTGNIIRMLLCAGVFMTFVSCHDIDANGQDKPDDDGVPAVAEGTWIMNSFEKISDYAKSEPSNRAALSLLRNETEHLQLVIRTMSNEMLSIVREGGDDAVELICREVQSFDKLENDVLVPCDGQVKPQRGNIVNVWLSFRASSMASAGRHKEVIRFRGARHEYAVAIDITVEDASVPEVPYLPAVFGINPDNFILNGLTEDQKVEKRKEVSDLLLGYRIAPYFSTWLNGTMRTEVNSSPYPWNDDRTWKYLSDPRFGRIALPFHGLTDDELGIMLERAREEGLLDKAYFYIWDEPTLQNEYDQIREMADRLHGHAPEAKVITTFYCGKKDDNPDNDDIFGVFDLLGGATDIFCTGVWSLQGNERRSQMCRDKLKDGQEWWQYVCMADYPGLAWNSNGIPDRAVMWRAWKEQPTGFLYWVVNSFGSMTPLRLRAGLPDGDGVLVYPGEPFGVDVPCVSVRLERWRDGAEDYDMLEMYAEKNGRQAAEELLHDVYRNPSVFTSEITRLEAFRKKLIEGLR